MTPDDVRAAAERLVDFHERFALLFGKAQAQDHAYDYLRGLMVCPERKGVEPIALTRGSSKRQALADAGAAHVIATDEQDLVGEILGLTGGKGARVVFDPIGGPTFAKLARATARLGILFLTAP